MLEIKEATLVIGGMIELKDTPEDPCPEETVEDVRQRMFDLVDAHVKA